MGEDSALDERRETVAHRIDFVELLDADGPLSPRDVGERLPHSRPTVTRALKELREADLVERQEGGYVPTLAGTMAAAEYRRYETASEAILSARELLETIPPEHGPPVDVLIGADRSHAETTVPLRALEALTDRLRRAGSYRVYLPTLVNTQLLRVWHRSVVGGGVESEAIFDPDLLTALKGQYPHLLAEMAAAEGFGAVSAAGAPYGLVLTVDGDDETMAMVVYENGTALRGILTNDTPEAVDWARSELDRLGSEGTDVTGDLHALSAAVADGVSQLPRAGGSLGPSPDDLREATDEHALPLDLETEGFVRLSQAYFDAHGTASPSVSWRTGFTLPEVRAGHAVDRDDDEGRNLTERLVAGLETGTDHVLLGPPGAGKSTIGMAVACEWNERGLGPVLYRERGDGNRFESPTLLEAYLRQTDGHALVVVEDAIRDEANDVLAVMQALEADPSVTFLLEARTREWRDSPGTGLDARREAFRRTALEEIAVSDLDERECHRFVEHFSTLVDAEIDLSGDELFEMIQTGDAVEAALPAGDALLAQHHLARRHEPPVDARVTAVTALDEAVRDTYERLADDGRRFGADLAILVATLTAAGVPVAEEYLFAIAEPDEYAAVDEAIDRLQGRLLFGRDKTAMGGAATYRTRHETWAMRFLEQVLDLEPVGRAVERFGRVVSSVVTLADEPDRRSAIRRHLGGRTPHLHRIEADPGGWADEVLKRVFDVGRTNANLAPLFGESTTDPVDIPETASPWTRLERAYWRGEMNRIHGDLGRAEREYRTLEELAQELEVPDGTDTDPPTPRFTADQDTDRDDESAHRKRWLATSRTNLGWIASSRGDHERAAEHHGAALTRFRDIGDRVGETISLKNLGTAAFNQADYDRARIHFSRSRHIAAELDASRIEADSLNSLGAVATRQSDYEAGREFFERSLAIAREVGDRMGEAARRNNLGVIATHRGAYDRAKEHCERSLAIERELGNRRGEANSLNNLGQVARKRGDYEEARAYLEESLAIRRDVADRAGEGTSLVNLGAVALAEGARDEAAEYFDRAEAVFEAIDAANGLAEVSYERGRLALSRDATDEAEDRARRALEAFEGLELDVWVARCHLLLGRVAATTGSLDEARGHWREALATFEAVDAAPGSLETLAELVETCNEVGDEERARKWNGRALDVVSAAPTTTAERHRDWIERYADRLADEGPD